MDRGCAFIRCPFVDWTKRSNIGNSIGLNARSPVEQPTLAPNPSTLRTQFGLVPVDHMGTSDRWRERRRLLLQTATVYDKLDELIAGAKDNTVSLAVFKPARVIDFIWEDDDRQWSQQRLEQMRALHSQLALLKTIAGARRFR